MARLARLVRRTSDGSHRSGKSGAVMAVIWYRIPNTAALDDVSRDEKAGDDQQHEGHRHQGEPPLDERSDRLAIEPEQSGDEEEAGAARGDRGEDERRRVVGGHAAGDRDELVGD